MKLTRFLLFFLVLIIAGCKSKRDTSNSENPKPKRKKILTGVTITAVGITQFPKFSGDGEKWDAYAPFATDPDLFVVLKWNENLIYKSETRNDCQFGSPVAFSQSLPVEVKMFDQPLLFEVFDEDGVSSNDNVGYFNMNLKDYEGQKEFDLKQGELIVHFTADWIYSTK